MEREGRADPGTPNGHLARPTGDGRACRLLLPVPSTHSWWGGVTTRAVVTKGKPGRDSVRAWVVVLVPARSPLEQLARWGLAIVTQDVERPPRRRRAHDLIRRKIHLGAPTPLPSEQVVPIPDAPAAG